MTRTGIDCSSGESLPLSRNAATNAPFCSVFRIFGAMPPPSYMPPVASTFSAMLPVSAPYAEANVFIVSKQMELDPSSRTLPDDCVRIFVREPRFQPCGLIEFFYIAQKRIDVRDAQARDDALETDAAFQRAAQIFEQRDFAVIARGEIAMAALGRNRAMRSCHPRSAQPRPVRCLRQSGPGAPRRWGRLHAE